MSTIPSILVSFEGAVIKRILLPHIVAAQQGVFLAQHCHRGGV